MHRALWLAVLLPSLGGCEIAPQDGGYGYAQPGYPAGAYAQPGYQTAPPGYDPYAAYPGYGYNDGAPAFVGGGAPVPLVMYGNEWGYHDSERRFHRAPEGMWRHLQERRETGGQFHRDAYPRGEDRREPRHEGRPFGGGERSGGQPVFRPAEHARPVEQARPAGVGVSPRSAPAFQPRHEEQQRRRDCPPGQRC